MLKKTRQEFLVLNPVLSNHLMILQDDKYNPDHYPVEEGDEVFLEEENMTVSLTQEEADQINQEDKVFYLSTKDCHKIDPKIEWVASEKLIPQEKETTSYLAVLVAVFTELTSLFPNQELLVMGDWPTPWLMQKNTSEEKAKEVYKYFKSNCKATFNGGFVVSKEEFSSFIPHLFWLSRYNATLPDFLMSFEHGKTIFSICKYGVLHLECYDAEEHQRIMELLKTLGLKTVEECEDAVRFD